MSLRGIHHGIFLFFPSSSVGRHCSTAALWFTPLVFLLQLIQAALEGLGGVFKGVETLRLGQHSLVERGQGCLRKEYWQGECGKAIME